MYDPVFKVDNCSKQTNHMEYLTKFKGAILGNEQRLDKQHLSANRAELP